jgi:hypothetical protein
VSSLEFAAISGLSSCGRHRAHPSLGSYPPQEGTSAALRQGAHVQRGRAMEACHRRPWRLHTASPAIVRSASSSPPSLCVRDPGLRRRRSAASPASASITAAASTAAAIRLPTRCARVSTDSNSSVRSRTSSPSDSTDFRSRSRLAGSSLRPRDGGSSHSRTSATNGARVPDTGGGSVDLSRIWQRIDQAPGHRHPNSPGRDTRPRPSARRRPNRAVKVEITNNGHFHGEDR